LLCRIGQGVDFRFKVRNLLVKIGHPSMFSLIVRRRSGSQSAPYIGVDGVSVNQAR
jgi:hypothetical protein